MRILIAVSELYPFSKTGGLADMVYAMGKTLAKHGHNVTIVTPLYKGIYEKYNPEETYRFHVQLGQNSLNATILTLRKSDFLNIAFVSNPSFFFRESLYGYKGTDYPDNDARFIFFSKCVVELAKRLNPQPEIIHVHDWQTAIIPLIIRHLENSKQWGISPKSILTIHNIAFQGIFPKDSYNLTNLPWDYFTPEGIEYYGKMNCLKAGIVFSEKIITVSPRYAKEILTPEYGCGLDGVLRWRNNSVIGILNGVDYEEWNTEHNPYIYASYNVNDLRGKQICKSRLQEELKLKVDNDVPLFATISRLTDQKGMDILLEALKLAKDLNYQFVLLGCGDSYFEQQFEDLAKTYPEKIRVFIGFDQIMAHRIKSGADFFLMPSKFEPCGLNQMYSLKYGTIPIVRRTGGLDDTVIDITDNIKLANGIKFTEYSGSALYKAIRKAFAIFAIPKLLNFYRKNAMNTNFSWDRAANEYEKVYRNVLESNAH